MHRTTEIATGVCHMGTTGVRRPECRSINPASIQICHARENRRGISEGTWTEDRDVDGREGGGKRDEPMHTMRDVRRERVEERGSDTVGGPRHRRVNTKAPRRFTTPPVPRPLFNLSETFWHTGHFHCRPRNDDTRYVDPRRLSRRLARRHRWQKRRSKLQTHFRMSDDVIPCFWLVGNIFPVYRDVNTYNVTFVSVASLNQEYLRSAKFNTSKMPI